MVGQTSVDFAAILALDFLFLDLQRPRISVISGVYAIQATQIIGRRCGGDWRGGDRLLVAQDVIKLLKVVVVEK